MNDVYRKCASVVVLKPSQNNFEFEVLLVHKPRKKDAWQLPQGGVEDLETVEQAALRELKEEAGLDATFIGQSNIVYKYEFPKSYRRFRPDNVCGQRIEFIFAKPLSSNPTVSIDNNEIDAYVWTDIENINNYIYRDEYIDIVKKLITEGIEMVNASNKPS